MTELLTGSDITQEETLRLYEAQWIEAAKTGDPEAIGQLYELHYDSIHSRVARDVDPYTAEDLTQSTMLRVLYSPSFKDIEFFNGKNPEASGLRAYLLRTATNVIIDEYRRSKRKPAVSLEVMLEANQEPTISAAQEAQTDIIEERLENIVSVMANELTQEQAASITLSALGFTYEEIGKHHGVCLGTVRSRLNRGRLRLVELYRQGLIDAPEGTTFGMYPKERSDQSDLCA